MIILQKLQAGGNPPLIPTYRVYHILFTGNDNTPPTVEVQENDFADPITWSRDNEGIWHCFANGQFTLGKTSIICGQNFSNLNGTKSIKTYDLTADGFWVTCLNSGTASDIVPVRTPIIVLVKI